MTTNTIAIRNATHDIRTQMITPRSPLTPLLARQQGEADWGELRAPAGHAPPEGTFGKGSLQARRAREYSPVVCGVPKRERLFASCRGYRDRIQRMIAVSHEHESRDAKQDTD